MALRSCRWRPCRGRRRFRAARRRRAASGGSRARRAARPRRGRGRGRRRARRARPGSSRRASIEAAVDRREGQGLEAEHRPVAALGNARRGHHGEGLDADAEGALAVVAGLDRQDHAGQQRLEAAPRQALRPLVDAEVGADAVAGAVVVVVAGAPQRGAGDRVDVAAGEALGPAQARHGDEALEHEGEGPDRRGRRRRRRRRCG